MRRIVVLFTIILCILAETVPVSATSLKVTPLNYDIVLNQGEKKKGFIDFTNPSAEQVAVAFNVKAFRQINSNGDLEFYEDERVNEAIKLDYETVELAPREAIHLAFIVDGTRLAQGDNFAAIFANTATAENTPLASTVRVGALLFIKNGTTAERKAEITNLSLPFWQPNGEVTGNYTVKNTGDQKKASGFFPDVSVNIDPLHQQTSSRSGLVFAGIERSNQFIVKTGRFGIYCVTVRYGDSSKSALVFVATPLQLFVLVALILLGALVLAVVLKRRKESKL